MKIFRYITLGFSVIGMATISSCMKKYDADSYAPALNINGYTSSGEVAKANLVAYWPFDGNLTDVLSNTTGTGTSTSFAAGIKGSALSATGSSYVVSNTPAAVQKLSSFTITTWVYAAQNTSGIATILDIVNPTSFWGNLDLFFENGGTATTGQLKLHVNSNGTDYFYGNYPVSNPWNNWINIAVSYDEQTSTFNLYANGSKIGTATQANLGAIRFVNPSKMVFGTVQFQTNPSLTSATTSQPWANFINGQIDEVRIYNKALSATDISTIVKLENRGK